MDYLVRLQNCYELSHEIILRKYLWYQDNLIPRYKQITVLSIHSEVHYSYKVVAMFLVFTLSESKVAMYLQSLLYLWSVAFWVNTFPFVAYVCLQFTDTLSSFNQTWVILIRFVVRTRKKISISRKLMNSLFSLPKNIQYSTRKSIRPLKDNVYGI